jgi:hypothetical protein
MLSSGVCPQRHPGWVHGVASSTQPGLAARCDRAAEGYYAPHRGRRMAADGDQWQQAGSAPDTGALPRSNRSTPGGWSIWRPDLCPPDEVHSKRGQDRESSGGGRDRGLSGPHRRRLERALASRLILRRRLICYSAARRAACSTRLLIVATWFANLAHV